RTGGDAGRRDRGAALRGHARPRLPQALFARRGAARARPAPGAPARGRGRPRVGHRRRPGRLDPSLRRLAQAPQPAFLRRCAAPAPRDGSVMTFLWPELLWLLAAVPVLVALYLFLLRRKKKAALAYASLSMVKAAMGPGQRFRRHIPPLLFLLALIAM